MTNDPEAVVRAFFESLSSGQMLEAIETWCTDDCRWENSGLPSAESKAAMLQMMKTFIEGFSMSALVIDVHELAVCGDTVLTERTDHMDGPGGKRLLSFPLAGVLRIRDGRIHRWTDYFDPRPLLPPGTT